MKKATQNVWQHHFLEPCWGRGGGGGGCGIIWPTEVVEIATLHELDGNGGFFTTSFDPDMGHTYFTHFTLKRTQRVAF